MQRVEMEELRQREANLTALNAIGPRKKPKLEVGLSPSLQVNLYIMCVLYNLGILFDILKLIKIWKFPLCDEKIPVLC